MPLEYVENSNYLPTSVVSKENENDIDEDIVGEKIFTYNGRIFYFLKVIKFEIEL